MTTGLEEYEEDENCEFDFTEEAAQFFIFYSNKVTRPYFNFFN